MIYQVKTSEYSTPWEPNEEDQVTSKQNTSIAKDQLQRDLLRLLELFREQELSSGVNINLRVAYPTVRESSTNDLILTKEDFDGPGDKLLDKLGLNFSPSEPPTLSLSSEEIKYLFLTLVARYIGLLSCVPLKTCSEALEHGQERIDLEIKSVDQAYRAGTVEHNETEQTEEQEDQTVPLSQVNSLTIKELLLQRDELSRHIKEAIETRAYREGPFKKKYPEIFSVIDWKKLKLDNKVRL